MKFKECATCNVTYKSVCQVCVKEADNKKPKYWSEETIKGWIKEGVNYWENPDCPKECLEGALVRLIQEIEDVTLPINHFETWNEGELREKVEFYEYLADK